MTETHSSGPPRNSGGPPKPFRPGRGSQRGRGVAGGRPSESHGRRSSVLPWQERRERLELLAQAFVVPLELFAGRRSDAQRRARYGRWSARRHRREGSDLDLPRRVARGLAQGQGSVVDRLRGVAIPDPMTSKLATISTWGRSDPIAVAVRFPWNESDHRGGGRARHHVELRTSERPLQIATPRSSVAGHIRPAGKQCVDV